MPGDEWRPSDTDLTADIDKRDLPDETVEYFQARRPDSITPMSVPDLHDALNADSDIVFQRDLYEYVDEIVRDARARDEPYRMSMELETTQHAYVAKYAHAIPTEDALQYLCDYDPLIELFSGNGYWAYELEQRGCDITAFDADPPRDTWTNVKKGTQDALLRHAENSSSVSLVLCWPPIGPAAYEALLVARPDDVFFIGELPRNGLKMMADEKFFKILEGRYECVREIPLPRLQGHMDSVFHFRRDE